MDCSTKHHLCYPCCDNNDPHSWVPHTDRLHWQDARAKDSGTIGATVVYLWHISCGTTSTAGDNAEQTGMGFATRKTQSSLGSKTFRASI